jgi:peptide/nickel transport system permease protein
MTRYLVRRLFWGLIVVWVVVTSVFAMFFIAPHDVARLIAGRQASEETMERVRHRLGLDQSIPMQYVHFLGRIIRGDLGESFLTLESVSAVVKRDVPITASLAIGGAILWLIGGVAAGVVAATRPRSAADRAITTAALFFYSMPPFLVGELLLLFLFFRLYMAGYAFFPPGAYVPLLEDPVQWARHLILPWLSIALVTAATYSRLTRAAMLDALGEDYIKTARAKGIRESRVIWRHALRSSLGAVVTQFGIDLGWLLGGAIVTEVVFGLPGLGREVVLAITSQDLPVIIGITILSSALVVAANVAVDLAYAVLDPRVRES